MDNKREYIKNNRGHTWKLNDYEHPEGVRSVDIFGYESGRIHNGPICTVCGYGFCHHCHDLPQQDCTND